MTSLILGTAQFGAGYGVTNEFGRIDDESMSRILEVADQAEIQVFDTAPDYGDAQLRLGRLSGQGAGRQFISKFVLPLEGGGVLSEEHLFGSSLSALQVESLYGLLFHRVSDLRDSRAPEAWMRLQAARRSGLIGKIGASIYDVNDLELIADRFVDLDLLQVPGNVLDRRLLSHPLLEELHDRGVEIHVRSAYLQGLLLKSPEELPTYFDDFQPAIHALHRRASSRGTPLIASLLGYLKFHPAVDAVLVGATQAKELTSTIGAWTSAREEDWSLDLPDFPAELLDPRYWPSRQELT
jgi:aryl-alcohol dehydrogenase-like predicted oxidoreductase